MGRLRTGNLRLNVTFSFASKCKGNHSKHEMLKWIMRPYTKYNKIHISKFCGKIPMCQGFLEKKTTFVWVLFRNPFLWLSFKCSLMPDKTNHAFDHAREFTQDITKTTFCADSFQNLMQGGKGNVV